MLARRGLVADRPMPSSSRLAAPSSRPKRQASSPWLRGVGLAQQVERAQRACGGRFVDARAPRVRRPARGSSRSATACVSPVSQVDARCAGRARAPGSGRRRRISRRPLRAEVTDSPSSLLRQDEDVARGRRRRRCSRSTKNTRRAVARGLELARASRATGRSAARSGRAAPRCCGCPRARRTAAAAPTTSSTGQPVRSTGRTKRVRPTPLANQIAISLSRYMRAERDDDGDEQRQRQHRRQVAERDVAEQQHHVLRRDRAARRLAQRCGSASSSARW